jgi:hypothetical protein
MTWVWRKRDGKLFSVPRSLSMPPCPARALLRHQDECSSGRNPMIELEHSPLGGSAAHRFMNCEGIVPFAAGANRGRRARKYRKRIREARHGRARIGREGHRHGLGALRISRRGIQRLSRRLARWHFAGRRTGLFFRVHGHSRPAQRAGQHALSKRQSIFPKFTRCCAAPSTSAFGRCSTGFSCATIKTVKASACRRRATSNCSITAIS